MTTGDRYEGYWKKNKRCGKGTQYYALINETYEGNFIDDKRTGKGKYIFKSGDVF